MYLSVNSRITYIVHSGTYSIACKEHLPQFPRLRYSFIHRRQDWCPNGYGGSCKPVHSCCPAIGKENAAGKVKARGRVLTDAQDAKKLVRKGHHSYASAQAIAKPGTLASVKYNVQTGAAATAAAGGITVVTALATADWKDGEAKDTSSSCRRVQRSTCYRHTCRNLSSDQIRDAMSRCSCECSYCCRRHSLWPLSRQHIHYPS